MKLSLPIINKIWALYFEGYTSGEIAKKLNISEADVVKTLRPRD